MAASFQISSALAAPLRVLVLALISNGIFGCAPLVCQNQVAQTNVPRPASASTTQAPTQVPHPPEAQSQHPADGDDQSTPTFKVNVKLVNVFTTVTNAAGQPVSSLKQDDFQLFEDGYPQQIAVFHRESELPLSIVVAIDTSLSTRGDQRLELESARRFAHTILRPIDGLSLFQFSEIVDQLTPFTADMRTIDKAINRVHSGAATALYDTLYLGSDALLARRGRKVMVVITDGGDTVSKTSYQEAIREAQEAEVILYSIIIVPIENSAGRDIGGEHALIQLARDTGGKYFYASGIEQLDAAFRQISDELRTQYLIAYYPSRRVADSDFRSIEIKLNPTTKDYPDPSQLVVRHRTGYYTMPSK
jgi:Ca-activated chloride channel homolog